MDNIREAVAIAHNLRDEDPKVERLMGRLVDEVASFRSQPLRLTHVELPEDAE